MTRTHRVLVFWGLCSTLGCSLWRDQLEEEKTSLEKRQADVREILDKNAPVGSQWAAHRDTERLLGDINKSQQRINEIDRELSR